MKLSVDIQGSAAKLMRGGVQIGLITRDNQHQIKEVAIFPAASQDEDELIIRLAASHVAQFIAKRSLSHAMVLREKLATTNDLRPEQSDALLDFDAIAPQHAGLTQQELESVMARVGVVIRRG